MTWFPSWSFEVYLKVQEIQYHHHHTGCIEHVKLNQICIECGTLNQCVLITAWSWSLSKTRGFNGKSRHKQEFIEASFICWHQGCSLLWSGRPEEKNRIRSFHPAGLFETLQFWTLPNYFSHQDFVFLNKECFDHPRQKTNLCIDLDLWWWLNIEVINIILQHQHFLLRSWLEREI